MIKLKSENQHSVTTKLTNQENPKYNVIKSKFNQKKKSTDGKARVYQVITFVSSSIWYGASIDECEDVIPTWVSRWDYVYKKHPWSITL